MLIIFLKRWIMKSNLDESSYMKKREDTNRHYTKRKRTPDSHVNIMQLSRIHFIKPDTGLDEPDIKLDTLVKPSWWNLIVPNLKMSLHHRSYNLGVKMLLAGKRWKKAKKVACGEAWQRVWEIMIQTLLGYTVVTIYFKLLFLV